MSINKRTFKAFKVLWFLGGIALLCTVLFSFIKIQISAGQGDSVRTLFFAAGLYVFIIYLITTLIIILSGEIIKRMKELYFYEKTSRIKRIIRRTYERAPRQ